MPPAVGAFPALTTNFGPITFYLPPFIEQDNLWKLSQSTAGNWNANTSATGLGTYPGATAGPKLYLCPSDPSVVQPVGLGSGYPGWGATCLLMQLAGFRQRSDQLIRILAELPEPGPDVRRRHVQHDHVLREVRVGQRQPRHWASLGQTMTAAAISGALDSP